MLTLAILLNCSAAVLLVLSALKYGRGPVPLTYHAEMLAKEGTTLSPYMVLILRGLYRALAGGMLSCAILIVALSLGPIAQDILSAQLAVALAGVAFAAAGYVVPRQVEEQSGVQTPWRLSLLLGGMLIAGFVLGVLG